MEAYDLYSGTYVPLPKPVAQRPDEASFLSMASHDRLLAERGYEGVAAIVEGYGGYCSASSFIGFDEASELPEPRKWPPPKHTYEWRFEAPLTLRERERAHVKTLNGGDQPWKRKQK